MSSERECLIEEGLELPSISRAKLLRDQVYDVLRDNILRGAIAPNCRLVEDELAEQLDVSRTPVREALQRLQVEGWVIASTGRGFEVASIDAGDVEGALDIRLILESYAARQAVERRTLAQLETLWEICREEQRQLRVGTSSSLTQLLEINRRFHHQVVACAESSTLLSIVSYLEAQAVYRLFALGDPDNLALFAASHRRITQAIQDRDAEAAEAEVAYHIDLAKQILIVNRGR